MNFLLFDPSVLFGVFFPLNNGDFSFPFQVRRVFFFSFSLEDVKTRYKYMLNLSFVPVLCIKMRLLLPKIWKEII